MHLDLAIVGAGLAGLSAAYEISAHKNDCNKHSLGIFEARQRVGGKVLTRPYQGHWLEDGALAIDSSHTELLSLLTTLGLNVGDRLQLTHMREVQARVYMLHNEEISTADLEQYFSPLFSVLASVDFDPEQLNPFSYEAYIKNLPGVSDRLKSDFLALSKTILSAEYGVELDQINANHLFEIPGCDHAPARWLTRAIGDHRYRVEGGNHLLVERLCDSIPDECLHLGHQLLEVNQTSSGYELLFQAAGRCLTYTADRLILATPINLYHWEGDESPHSETRIRLNLNEGVEKEWQSKIKRTQVGSNRKLFLHFDKPVWLDKNQQREVLSIIHPDFRAWNGGHPQAHSEAGSIVTLFISAQQADTHWNLEAKQRFAKHFINSASQVLPELSDSKLLNMIEGHYWGADPYSLGSYGGVVKPGEWRVSETSENHCRVGNMIFAGSEWHSCLDGYMVGAVASGRQAAIALLEKNTLD